MIVQFDSGTELQGPALIISGLVGFVPFMSVTKSPATPFSDNNG